MQTLFRLCLTQNRSGIWNTQALNVHQRFNFLLELFQVPFNSYIEWVRQVTHDIISLVTRSYCPLSAVVHKLLPLQHAQSLLLVSAVIQLCLIR